MGLTCNTASIRDGSLIVHLDATNPRSYNGSGTTWSDLSGNGYHATLKNGATISNGTLNLEYSTAAHEPGNDYVSIDDYAVAGQPAPLTYQCWFNFTSTDRDISYQHMNLMGPAGTSPTGSGMSLGIHATELLWTLVYNDSQQQTQMRNNTAEVLQADKWYMATLTHDGTTVKQYLNTALNHTASVDGYTPYTTQAFTIGLNRIYYHFGGQMSDIKIYKKALTEDEILTNFESIRGRYDI